MNINSRKGKDAIILLIALFAHTAWLPAQSMNISDSRPITNGSGVITFTSDGATALVSPPTGYTAPPDYKVTWNGDIRMNSSGIFQIDNTGSGSSLIETTFTLEGDLTGPGDFTKTGTGTFVLKDGEFLPSFTGKIIIEAGIFELGSDGELHKDIAVILNGGTLDISAASDQEIASLEGAKGSTVNLGDKTLTVGGNNANSTFSGTLKGGSLPPPPSSSGTFAKTGTGTMSFIGTTIEGDVDVQVTDGTFVVSGITGAFGEVTIDGNTAQFILGIDPDIFEIITVGELEIKDDGTLRMRVDEEGGHDQIKGLTTANTSEGTIEIDALAGKYDTSSGDLKYSLFTGTTTSISPSDPLRQKFLNGTLTGGELTITGRKDDYFQSLAQTWNSTPNQRQLAVALDKVTTAGPWEAMTQISQSTTNPALIQAAYNQMAGDLRANSMMLGQWQTSRYGLNHLDLTNCGASYGSRLWLEIVHQTTNFNGDGNSGDYGISRSGFLVGSEERRVDTTYGFFVGYSYPFLYDHGDKVEAGDLQFGFYGGSKVGDVLETKLFLGYGHQGYRSKRHITNELLIDTQNPYWDPRIKGKYSGDSMSMSLEFGLPLSSGFFCLRPVLAIDSDLTWQYGFTETGTTGLELWHSRSFMDRSFLRTGLTMQLGSVEQCDTFSLLGRAYYGHQVFSHSSPMTRSRFATEDPANQMTFYGVDPGRDYVNLGVGLCWNIDNSRSFYGDYDFNAFRRSTAHGGTFGFRMQW